MYADRRILTLRCMTTPSRTSQSRREWVSGRVRTRKRRTWIDTLRGRDSSLIKLVTSLFQADCHDRHGGVRRRALPGGGPGRYTSQRTLVEDQGFCGRRSSLERAPCLAGTPSISSPLGQRAWEGVGGHTKTFRHRRGGFVVLALLARTSPENYALTHGAHDP